MFPSKEDAAKMVAQEKAIELGVFGLVKEIALTGKVQTVRGTRLQTAESEWEGCKLTFTDLAEAEFEAVDMLDMKAVASRIAGKMGLRPT